MSGLFSKDKTRRLTEQIKRLSEQGRYVDAITPSKELCELLKTVDEPRRSSYSASLSNLTGLYVAIGNYQAAEPLLLQRLDLTREALGQSHPKYAAHLDDLGTLYEAMGNFEAAEPLYRQALNIVSETLGKIHPRYPESLNNLVRFYKKTGNFEAAEALSSRANSVGFKTTNGELPDPGRLAEKKADRLYEQFSGLYKQGRYEEAITPAKELCELLKTVDDSKNSNYAASLGNLANLYYKMGNYEAAEPLYKQAIDIMRQTHRDKDRNYASGLNSLAELYHDMGNYGAAEPLYRQAIDIMRQAVGENHPDYAALLNNLALFTGNIEEKVELLLRALEIRRKTVGENHPDYAQSLAHFSNLISISDSHEAAEPLLRQALKIRRETLGENHPDYAASLTNLALHYLLTGNYEAAEPLLKQAPDIFRACFGEHHPIYARSLENLGLCYAAVDRAAEAFDLVTQTAVIYDHVTAQIFSIGSENQRMAYIQSIQYQVDMVLSLVSQRCPPSNVATQAAMNLVLRRKAIGAEALAAQRDAVLGGKYPQLRDELAKLRSLNSQIARTMLAGPGDKGIDAHQQRLNEWNIEREQLEADLARQIPEMSLEQQLKAVDYHAVAGALPEGTALVEFVRFVPFDFAAPACGESFKGSPRYLAFVLRAREPKSLQMIDLGDAEAIDRLITDLRTKITGENEARTAAYGSSDGVVYAASFNDVGTDIRSVVFDPLIPHIKGTIHLFIAPDGELTRLPFEVLPSNDGGYLIDAYRLSYLSVGRDVLRFGHDRINEPADPIVVADPDFDLASSSSYEHRTKVASPHLRDLTRALQAVSRLPGTAVEGKRIADMLNVPSWLDKEALERPLKSVISPRILHLATHGFFLKDQQSETPVSSQQGDFATLMLDRISSSGIKNPLLRSGLVLAGFNTWLKGGAPPQEAEDGVLTAEDVSGLDLTNTDLVVLSACETGLGDVHVGEGVFGLRRAFVLAGAKTLIMSLWKVPDEPTKELMIDFYSRILKGVPRAEALRDAQLAIKKNYPHPYFWGAFICQGDPGALIL